MVYFFRGGVAAPNTLLFVAADLGSGPRPASAHDSRDPD
jgi:hypothetical protein